MINSPPEVAGERQAFEAHIKATEDREPLLWSTLFATSISGETMPAHFEGKYFIQADQKAWLAWQAARASTAAPEAFVRDLLWNDQPECCGSPVVGAEYMGAQEMVCCGNPEPALLNDAQIVASLRARFPEIAASPKTNGGT